MDVQMKGKSFAAQNLMQIKVDKWRRKDKGYFKRDIVQYGITESYVYEWTSNWTPTNQSIKSVVSETFIARDSLVAVHAFKGTRRKNK